VSDYKVKIERAANCSEEFALITSIVDDLSNETQRLVYADWLDAQGDSRAEVLRQLSTVSPTDETFPDLTQFSPAWADIVGLTICQKIFEAKIWHSRRELLSVVRPAIELRVKEADFDSPPTTPDEIGTTRLGGDPDLPEGSTYPRDKDGKPFHFIGQFDLADLAGTVLGRNFPERGLLSIFRTQADEVFLDPFVDDVARFVVYTDASEQLVRIHRPQQDEQLAPFRPDLKLTETLRLPGELGDWTILSSEEIDALDAVFPTNLGGEKFLLGGHVTHGNTGGDEIADKPNRTEWFQLLLIPFFEGPDFGVTDMSSSLILPKKDLKAGRFDQLEFSFG
jgi:uncharacterized protein (TIGR02996 family)